MILTLYFELYNFKYKYKQLTKSYFLKTINASLAKTRLSFSCREFSIGLSGFYDYGLRFLTFSFLGWSLLV